MAFLAMHVPLLALIVYLAAGFTADATRTFVVILAATLIGTGLCLFALWRLIYPLKELTAAVKRYQADNTLQVVKTKRQDEIGVLTSAVMSMVSQVDAMTKKLRHEVMTDPLTGLRNRRWLMERFPIEQARAFRMREPMSVLVFDIDFFKRINDTHGHGVGDQVLMEVGEILSDCLRPYDLSARIGGEEFCVILPRTPSVRAAGIAQRLRKAFESMTVRPLERGEITCSFGVSEALPNETLSQVMSRGDKALYKAKELGRNCVIRALSDDRFERFSW
ncbi:GGDEF domain-containing protein [Oryzifoliimicrobium ureilyticus]|uniref:GGDEF domain-containing protein n=1 Tax=Oryzifoliimicrobium ureilyticus TaxID=3113724 RepID=UPI003076401E